MKEEKKGRGKKRSRANKSFDEDASSSNKDIQKMFANMPIKKKKEVCFIIIIIIRNILFLIYK